MGQCEVTKQIERIGGPDVKLPRNGRCNAKLTEEQVREIRTLRLPLKRRRKQKHSLAELAARYGVSQTTICHVVYRQYWRDVT